MKKLLYTLTLLLTTYWATAQVTAKLSGDTTKMTSTTKNTVFVIENSTKNVLGFLHNEGGGKTSFKVPTVSDISGLAGMFVVNGSTPQTGGYNLTGNSTITGLFTLNGNLTMANAQFVVMLNNVGTGIRILQFDPNNDMLIGDGGVSHFRFNKNVPQYDFGTNYFGSGGYIEKYLFDGTVRWKHLDSSGTAPAFIMGIDATGKIIKTSFSGGGGSGTVTSVTSANSDIGVANTTTTPVLTLNNVNGVNKIYYDVTSSIQTQLNSKAPTASPIFTGAPLTPTAAGGTNTTQIASTAFVQSAISGISTPTLQIVASVGSTYTGNIATYSLDINGTGGVGYIDLLAQSSPPATPATNHQRVYADANGRWSIVGSNGFGLSFSKSFFTSSHIVNWPDSAGIVALENRIIPNSNLANFAITVNGTSVSLGGTRTLTLASSDFVNQGTTTTLLHGNAAGNPSFGQIVNADIANSTIDLTTKVTGVLSITNGGTGSATQNFVDLTTTQPSIGGAKTFTSAPTFSTMTAGSVPVIATSGLLSQDNPNFFYNLSNHRLSLGTTGGSGVLNLEGAQLLLSSSGASTSPKYMEFGNTSGDFVFGINGNASFLYPNTSSYAMILGTGLTNPMQFLTTALVRMSIGSNGNIGIGPSTSPSSLLNLNGNISASAWGVNGVNFQTTAATYTNASTASSGTTTNAAINSFGIPTLAASNTSVTTTSSSTVYVAGAPIAGTNMTITNPYALQIASGNSLFSGNLTATGSIILSNLATNGFVKTTGGTGALSVSSTVNLTSEVTGTLPTSNGGTGTTNSVPYVVGGANLAAQTGSITVSTTAVGASTATFTIGTYLTVTALVAATINVTISWTDQNNNASSINSFINVSATGSYAGPDYTIRAKNGTNIVISTTSIGTSETYDVGSKIMLVP